MTWTFDKVAGPYNGPAGGLVWDGSGMLFSLISEERILRFDAASNASTEYRRYTGRTNGIAAGPRGSLYGCQEGGRRVVHYLADGSATVTATRLNGRIHNHPCDLTVDRAGRVWFSDPHSGTPAFGPKIFPPLEHASVLRLERDDRKSWAIRRMTYDTRAPRAVLLSIDEKTLYVAEGDEKTALRELRAYAVRYNGELGPYTVLHTFGADHRGAHRGIEGMCLDADGNIVACAGAQGIGAGALVYVFSPAGAVLETHALPAELPMRCAFGDAGLSSLYVTTAGGELLRARNCSRRGHARAD